MNKQSILVINYVLIIKKKLDNKMFTNDYIQEVIKISSLLDANKIEKLALNLADLRSKKGRLFFLGVGGSAGNASHAVNDFRKLCGIEAYSPTDNVSELTARTNDEGWEVVFTEWLKVSNLSDKDALFIFSVGGGNLEKNISTNIVYALDYARIINAKIYGIIGKKDGYTNKVGDNVIVVPNVNEKRVTPHSEAFQAVIWHCLVSNPVLQMTATKW